MEKEKYLIETLRGLGIGLVVAGVVSNLIQNNPDGISLIFFGLFLII